MRRLTVLCLIVVAGTFTACASRSHSGQRASRIPQPGSSAMLAPLNIDKEHCGRLREGRDSVEARARAALYDAGARGRWKVFDIELVMDRGYAVALAPDDPLPAGHLRMDGEALVWVNKWNMCSYILPNNFG